MSNRLTRARIILDLEDGSRYGFDFVNPDEAVMETHDEGQFDYYADLLARGPVNVRYTLTIEGRDLMVIREDGFSPPPEQHAINPPQIELERRPF